jgi:hypothetical protein
MQCSYNTLIHGQFYYCDWDMWWTDDAQGIKNSILRAISGGPVYVSDKLGRSKKELLSPLVLSDGKVLMCDRPAMPAADCLTVDAKTSKKIFSWQTQNIFTTIMLNKSKKVKQLQKIYLVNPKNFH